MTLHCVTDHQALLLLTATAGGGALAHVHAVGELYETRVPVARRVDVLYRPPTVDLAAATQLEQVGVLAKRYSDNVRLLRKGVDVYYQNLEVRRGCKLPHSSEMPAVVDVRVVLKAVVQVANVLL